MVGIPEEAEGKDTAAFVVRLLTHALSLGQGSEPLMVERSHWTQERQESSAQAGTPIILKFLSYQQKVKVMR